MKYLPGDLHTFTLALVLAEHKSRFKEPLTVLDGSGTETPTSIVARFKCYETYEFCDWSLSRLAIESLVHPDLREEVLV